MPTLAAGAPRRSRRLSFSFGARAVPRRLGVCLLLLLAAGAAALAAPQRARIPFVLRVDGTHATLAIDGQRLTSSWPKGITTAQVSRAAAADRLFRDDGTDSSGTLTAPPTDPYAGISSPYERFLCALRECGTYSQWRDLAVRNGTTGRQLLRGGDAAALARIALPARFTLSGALQRPDIAASISFTGKDEISLVIDADHRAVHLGDQSVYFPRDWRPFLAEVLWTISHAYLWAILLLLLILALSLAYLPLACYLLRFTSRIDTADESGDAPIGSGADAWSPEAPRATSESRTMSPEVSDSDVAWAGTADDQPTVVADTLWVSAVRPEPEAQGSSRRFGPAELLASAALPMITVGAILIALLCISAFSYERLPRILDGVSYYFQGAILRSGNLWVPVPRAVSYLPGPFMVNLHGHWFSHYPPGTPLAIALGMLIGLPWVVEPLMGAAAALLIWRLARRWYGPPTALLTLALLALSPFFLFLAASYLSHMVALCALLLFLEGIDRVTATEDWRWAAASGLGAGYALLTRELDLALFGLPVLAFYAVAPGAGQRRGEPLDYYRLAGVVLAFMLPLLLCLLFYLFYDWRLTGSPWLTPRAAFDPRDTWGFGAGKGWNNQHTPAAGLFVMENQLTSLLIHLYGWPYYLTLSFFFFPLATLRLRPHDLLLYGIAAIFLLGYAGYFYHGIAFGPRYLFASLPAYVLLTARGMAEAAALAGQVAHRLAAAVDAWSWGIPPPSTSQQSGQGRACAAGIVAVALVALGLCACNLAYYLPRQIGLYHDYLDQRVDGSLTYDRLHPSWLHHALVLSDDWTFYADDLFPLNDPLMQGDVVYAYAPQSQSLTSLEATYRGRHLYRLTIRDRSLHFQVLSVAGTRTGH